MQSKIENFLCPLEFAFQRLKLLVARQENPPMQKYICTVCGYVYDPEEGDPDGGIEPGTPFEDIPDDWVCPVCGATKEQFEAEES